MSTESKLSEPSLYQVGQILRSTERRPGKAQIITIKLLEKTTKPSGTNPPYTLIAWVTQRYGPTYGLCWGPRTIITERGLGEKFVLVTDDFPPHQKEMMTRFDLGAAAREVRDAAMRKIREDFQAYIETHWRCPKCGGREPPVPGSDYVCRTCEGDVDLMPAPYTRPPWMPPVFADDQPPTFTEQTEPY